ncbi:MAG: hypothetical protein R3D03_10990 [Geminicoccaceae bacterium]
MCQQVIARNVMRGTGPTARARHRHALAAQTRDQGSSVNPAPNTLKM